MNPKNVQSSAIAMLLGALFLLAAGTYTDNGGIQLAGGILLVVALIVAFNQARVRP